MSRSSQLVSIIMATYNRGHYILETLNSIKAQTHSNWECIIVDDGGTDNTEKVIADILSKDTRFKFLKRPDKYLKGLSGSRNYGLDIVKGDYIIFFDDDDYVHLSNLEFCLKAIDSTQTDFCHYQKQSFKNKLPQVKTQPLKIERGLSVNDIESIVNGTSALASCTVLWKKSCFKTVRFNESLMYAEEWECYTRIILNNFKGISLSNVLYYNRKHAESNTGQFWGNNPVGLNSKKKAMVLIAENLYKNNSKTKTLESYFLGLAISYRDVKLLKQLLNVFRIKKYNAAYAFIKYYLFPLWSIKQKAKKNY